MEGWIMSGCKYALLKILGAFMIFALMLPRLALSEIGICPPYSRTFTPDDSVAEIQEFIAELNARPGGGTVILEPGGYPASTAIRISGIVCIRSTEPHSRRASMYSVLVWAETGAILTLRGVDFYATADFSGHSVESGAILFADHVGFSAQGRASTLPGYLENDGTTYLHDVSVSGNDGFSGIRNTGTLVMTGGHLGDSVYPLAPYDGLQNYGYALLERVVIGNNRSLSDGRAVRGIVNFADGILNVRSSIIAENATVDSTQGAIGIRNEGGGTAHIVSSTITDNGLEDEGEELSSGTGISNSGYLELEKSIVTDACDTVTDLGYNVGTCAANQATSIEADPQFMTDSIELGAGSPAIDRIPLELCSEFDALGRARTDGNGDGIVACDSGALEYGYAFVEATVRARPYHWREVGEIDLSTTDLITIYVFSSETFDATRILFETVAIEGFEQDAKGWPWTIDVGKDGLMDYQVTSWLNRQPPLPCGYQEHEFSAMTEDGTAVRGLLKFNAVGCTP
jgi:hypothetical protein